MRDSRTGYSFARRAFAIDPGLAKSPRNVVSVGLRFLWPTFWPHLPCAGTTVVWPILRPAVFIKCKHNSCLSRVAMTPKSMNKLLTSTHVSCNICKEFVLGLDCSGLLELSGLPRSGLLWLVLACYALSCGVLSYAELLWAVLACSGLFLVDLAVLGGMTPTEFAAKS